MSDYIQFLRGFKLICIVMLAASRSTVASSNHAAAHLLSLVRASILLVLSVSTPTAVRAATEEPTTPNTKTMWTIQSHKAALLTTPKDAAIQPHAVTVLPDGGAIVAGAISATKQGWASRVNAAGSVVWTFTAEIPPEDRKAFERDLVIGPTFRSAAVNSAGDTFLCGDVPRAVGSNSPTAYIAQLDRTGRLIRELFPKPAGTPMLRYQIAKCFPSGSSIVAIAQGVRVDVSKGLPAHTYSSAWVIWLDSNGAIERQVLVPASDANLSAAVDSFSIAPTEKGMLLALTDNVQTEFVSLDVEGHELARKLVQGRFMLVSDKQRSSIVEAFGITADSISLLRLDPALNVSQAARTSISRRIASRSVIRAPGGGFFVFGSSVHNFGEQYRSLALEISESLTPQKELPLSTGDFTDAGAVWAAAIAETSAATPQLVLARPYVPSATTSPNRGAIVDFIQLRKK